ncbi:MFS transporter [Nocardia sp. NPDC059246]|uniref:MFS transporter n=1 Tax=unclassified Nocardia TaxID=2637762 RepID=UPI00368D7F36
MNDGNGAARRKVLVAAGIGNFVEWYDSGLYALFATTIATVFFPKSDPTAALMSTFAIFALGYVTRPLGGVVFGHLGDRYGRRFTLLLSVMLMSAGTVAMGMLPSYAQIGIAAPVLLVLCRLVQSFSAGGEYTGSNIFVIEHAPSGRRGLYASISPAVSYTPVVVGVLVAEVMTSTTTPEQLTAWGWRVPFLAAAPLALVGLYLRWRVDESPEFAALRAQGKLESAPLKQAFKVAKGPMLILIGWAMAYAVAVFLLGTFILSYLTVTVKFSKTESLTVQLVFALVVMVAFVLAGYGIDRVGLKRMAVASALALGAWAVPTFILLQHASVLTASLVVAVCAVFFGGLGSTTVLAAVDLFPARIRASASGMAYNVCLLAFGSTAPYVATWLISEGNRLAPGYYLAGVCAVAAIVAAFGIGNHAPSQPLERCDTSMEPANVAGQSGSARVLINRSSFSSKQPSPRTNSKLNEKII